MNISIEHNLPEEKALQCAKKLLSHISQKQSRIVSKPVQMWDEGKCNFSFQVKSNIIKGTISVDEQVIVIKAKLPVSLSLFRGIIKEIIEKKSRELFEQCKEQ